MSASACSRRAQWASPPGSPRRRLGGCANRRVRMPPRASASWRAAARGAGVHRNSPQPPAGARSWRYSNAASRALRCSSRARAASCQRRSARARAATQRDGPARVHGPRWSRSRSSQIGSASTKPTRAPASPKNLPSERSTMSPGGNEPRQTGGGARVHEGLGRARRQRAGELRRHVHPVRSGLSAISYRHDRTTHLR